MADEDGLRTGAQRLGKLVRERLAGEHRAVAAHV
jgi:hypothetical protein